MANVQSYSPLPAEETATQYRLLAEQVDSYAIFLLDAEGRITAWNCGAARMSGYPAQEAIGRFFGFLYPLADQEQEQPQRNLEHARLHGHYEEERLRQRRDGSLYWAHVVITALRDGAGKLRGYAEAAFDLTRHKQLHECLLQRQDETRRILMAANAGAWQWNIVTGEIEVSENFLHLLGYDVNRIGGTAEEWMKIVHPNDAKPLSRKLRAVFAQRPHLPLVAELRLRTAGGDYRWFYLRADWHQEHGGEPHTLVGVSVDAHELHTAEEERQRLFHELEAERLRFRAILEQMPSGVIVAEVPSGEIIYRNAEITELLGAGAFGNGRAAPIGFDVRRADGRVIRPEQMPVVRAVQKGEVIRAEELVYRRPDGETVALSVNAAPIRDEDGVARVAVSVFHDIQTLKNTQASLAAEKERAQITLKVLSDGVIIVDPAGNVDYMNPAAERMTGWFLYEAKGVAARRVLDFDGAEAGPSLAMLVDDCLRGEWADACSRHEILRSRDGREYSVDAVIAPIHLPHGELIGAVLVLHDVTESRTLMRTLAYQASHDALTGLLNRREFEARLKRAIEHAKAGAGCGALLYLDLDQFKIVNDTCGHAAGDEMLQQLARCYQSVVRERDTFARLGGDEFALILEHCTVDEALGVANKVLETTTQFKYVYGDKSFRVGVSIGLVPVTQASFSVEQTMRLADHACYIAKENGRNRIYVHRDDNADILRRRSDMHWVGRLNEALRSDQLELFYQPIAPITGQEGRLHYEILLRLKDANGKHISPGAFLPAAERYDLMPAVDRWVLRKVISWLESQPRHVDDLGMCTINLSRRTLADESFQQYAIRALEKSSVPSDKLCFEITENGAIANPQRTIKFIETLKARGCRFSLDDFGTGMTSFSYLKLLPVDFIKIDGSFIMMMGDSAVDHEMVKFTNEISHIMGRQTIAEYVADESTYRKLHALRVDYAQGYWIGAPRPLQSVAA